MKCPNCGSENCQYITTTETHGGGIRWGDACCGTMLLGPVGILCGFCGSEVHTHTKEYWICNSCGRRFSQSEAERVMQDEAKRIKEFHFYLEMQEKFGSTNAKTDLGERIKQGEKLFLSPVFTDKELISSNPFIEDERLESIKYGITEVLTKEDLVYLVMPDMRIVFADKGMIYNNFNYGRPQEIRLYKNYIYFGQSYIQMPTTEKAEGFYRFLRYIYKGDMNGDGSRIDNYIKLLSELQRLPAEECTRNEHFSSQQEYAEYVGMIKENSFNKFKLTDYSNYCKYEEMGTEIEEFENRCWNYTKWSLIAVGIVFVIKMLEEDILSGLLAGIITLIPLLIFFVIKYIRLSGKKDEFAPDLVKKAIEESEKENYKKTGKLLVSDYVDVIDRTYF